MILATGRVQRGFSLLEILITLAILALFAGGLVLSFDDGQEAELLGEASQDLRALALKAKNRASTFRKDQFVILDDDRLILTEFVSSPGEGSIEPKAVIASAIIPLEIKVQSYFDERPTSADKRGFVWRFRSSGLSDPVRLRFSIGDSFTELDFNVLTAIAEEETLIRN